MHINVSKDQRKLIADKSLDLANLVMAGLVVGQLLSANKYIDLFVLGFMGYFTLFGLALFLTRGETDHE